MKLFSFWRSLATYRVRIALNLKGLVPDEVVDVNLIKGSQREAAYHAVNPMMALPALIDENATVMFKSLAIIEYLDETHPNPPLLPRDARGRARVRGLARIVTCNSHPLIVPRVREYLEHEFKLDEPTAPNGASFGTRPRSLHSKRTWKTLPPVAIATATRSRSPTSASRAKLREHNSSRSTPRGFRISLGSLIRFPRSTPSPARTP